jgi:mono/diheme cytochrome c family protein
MFRFCVYYLTLWEGILMIKSLILLSCLIWGPLVLASNGPGPDWSQGMRVSTPRADIYEAGEDLAKLTRWGLLHSLWYPVPVTGLKVPFKPIEFLSDPRKNPLKDLLLKISKITINISSPDDLYSWMGLKSYPPHEGEGAYFVPFKNQERPSVRMGVSFGESEGSRYVTASCVACHAESLFGRPVIGLPNKTPRANEAFYRAHEIIPRISGKALKSVMKVNEGDLLLWKKAQETLNWIGVKRPRVLGLDTSLATVALSLAKREMDPFATITQEAWRQPRKDVLENLVADSKPMPWFTLKYKNRWLSDGSVVSGNPVLTNILWNEIGRGVKLEELEEWALSSEGEKIIKELTGAVFATTPPRYIDFFGKKSIDVEKAQRGEELFHQSCFKCHGSYRKDWKTLETVEVSYPELTEVKDVGTDPQRWMGMRDLSRELNRLSFSETFGIKVVPQKGYVPPPLVGIWSRWPYFHNNSAPTLCDVLRNPQRRRSSWYVGSPVSPATDFDQTCNGFPLNAPKEWRSRERLYETRKPGLSNQGHFKHEYSEKEISELVMFLKTL